MKRLLTLFGIIFMIALVNMGGCGGNGNNDSGFKPSIESIKFFKNPEANPQVDAFTQGDDGIILVSIADYDLNADSIEVQIDQCTTASCNTSIPYHTEGPHTINQQTDAQFSYTLSGFIKLLPATHYYSFTIDVTDKEGQVDSKTQIIEVNTGISPVADKMIFYDKNEIAILLDSWNITKHYSYLTTEVSAHDLDLNTSQFYVERKCLSTQSGVIPTFPRIGPVKLTPQETQYFVLKLEAIKDADITSLIDGFTAEPGVFIITVELEDALGNTAQISRSITMTR